MVTKVLIAAGGTGGHVFPGIAIAEEIRRRHPEAQVVFAGTRRGLEASIVPRAGWPLVLLESMSIKDRKGIARLAAWARLPLSVLRAVRLLLAERPQLLICIGGYAAGPLSIAAWLLRTPFVIVEPNAIAGFTNRSIGRLARRTFVAFEEAKGFFPREKVVVSGNPVRAEVLAVRRDAPAGERVAFFVFGGSQGARRLNQAMTGALPLLADAKAKFRVIHQTGMSDDAGKIEEAYRVAGVEAEVFPFHDRIWECYREADVVVARAGATTVAELLALGIPSILVPYPYAADDHQRANARGMVRTGGAVAIEDEALSAGRLEQEMRSFIDRPTRIDAMRAALRRVSQPDAAKIIVEECWRLIRN